MSRMTRSLTFKLTAAFLGVSLGVIVLVAVLGYLAASNEFNRFVSQQAQDDFEVFVSDYYGQNSSLQGIDKQVRIIFQKQEGMTADHVRLVPFGLTTPNGVVVLGNELYREGDQVDAPVLSTGTKILRDGQVIGVVLPRPPPLPRNRAQEQFVERTLNTLLLSAGGAAVIALVLGVWLARTITRPVQDLTRAAQQMAKGELGQTVRVTSKDEVGELGLAFNQMSADLARSDQARRQMTADIAHELRNPLTVIGGYLDAMRNGDLQPTPTRLDAVHEEILHLERIVDDLRTLSLADAGALVLNRQPIVVDELLQRVANRFAPQAAAKKIALVVTSTANLPPLDIDDARITQVMDNLVGNALHHTEPGGKIDLNASRRESLVEIRVADTGHGIDPKDLPRVFERFYRGDKARPTDEGSSGLGLAIAKALVEAHGGKIWVESGLGMGATFYVDLPAVQPSDAG